MSKLQKFNKILIVSFSIGEKFNKDLLLLSKELSFHGIENQIVIVSEIDNIDVPNEAKLVYIQKSSKLHKIRSQIDVENEYHLCVIDSDMRLNISACVDVIKKTIFTNNAIGFGLIESDCNNTWLSKCISLDKYLSHRVLRPALHKVNMGITVPGQFVIYSPELLSHAQDHTDTFLDDLYFGLKCRTKNLSILRVNSVVGYETGRSSWITLVTQRIRWMKGLFKLWRDAFRIHGGSSYCGIHYFCYHGLPMILLLITLFSIKTAIWFFVLAVALIELLILSIAYKGVHPVFLLYAVTFPFIHLFATVGALLPIPIHYLRRR